MDKDKTLEAIAHELSEGLGKDGWLKRVGNVYFRCGHLNGNQVEDVYHASMRHNLNIELISMDWHYFTGTKEHALALQKVLGGGIRPSEYVTATKDGMDKAKCFKVDSARMDFTYNKLYSHPRCDKHYIWLVIKP